MEHKKSDILLIEGESARPGTYKGTDGRETKLTPEFLKYAFNKYDSTQPLYLTHDNREPMGIITSLSYSEETDRIYWKGIGFDKDKCNRANNEGFDYFSPEFDIKSNIADGNKDTPIIGTFIGGALTRTPAIATNTVNKSWVAFSEFDESKEQTVAEPIVSTLVEELPTKEFVEPIKPPIVNEKPIKSEPIEQKKNTIEIPKEITQPTWVKLDHGGYILMDKETQITKTDTEPESRTITEKRISPEETAQIELARKTLEEKQQNDANKIASLTKELESLREAHKNQTEQVTKYKTQFDTIMSSEIAAIENELREFGFDKPEDYMKDLDIEMRVKVLDSTRKQLIRSKDINSPLDVTITDGAKKNSVEEEFREMNIPEEYLRFIKH